MSRYTPQGNTRLLYATDAEWAAVGDTAALTLADIATFTDICGVQEGEALTPDGISGFETSTSNIDTPDMKSLVVSNIPGQVTTSEWELTYYDDTAVRPIFDLLSDGTTGAVIRTTLEPAVGVYYEATTITVTDRSLDDAADNTAQTWTATGSQGIKVKGNIAA